MSHFKPHEPMPFDLVEYRSQILENRGLHYNFPYGYKPSRNTNERFIATVLEPYITGVTLRGFFYAPGPDYVELEMRYEGYHNNYYYAMTKISNTNIVSYEYSGVGIGNSGSGETQYRINAPGYYSIGVRIEGERALAAFYKDTRLKSVHVGTMTGYTYELRIIGNSHYLLSLHISDEIEANPHFPNNYFGQRYWLNHPVLGIGSYWIMDCIVTNPGKPLQVCIVLYHIGKYKSSTGHKSEYGRAQFSLKNMRRQAEVTIYIRSVKGGWQVTTSFEDKSVLISNQSASKQDYIHPEISDSCHILTQHAEQGIQRYA